uniref:Secreted protein n=1 Tax=Anopheles stephensi TaxID=30069 RepID=A0A182XXJ1_ANOST
MRWVRLEPSSTPCAWLCVAPKSPGAARTTRSRGRNTEPSSTSSTLRSGITPTLAARPRSTANKVNTVSIREADRLELRGRKPLIP